MLIHRVYSEKIVPLQKQEIPLKSTVEYLQSLNNLEFRFYMLDLFNNLQKKLEIVKRAAFDVDIFIDVDFVGYFENMLRGSACYAGSVLYRQRTCYYFER